MYEKLDFQTKAIVDAIRAHGPERSCCACGERVSTAAAVEMEEGRLLPVLCQGCIGNLSDVANMSNLWD